MKRFWLGAALLAVTSASATMLTTGDASACLRAMEAPDRAKQKDAAHLVAQAEQSLDGGKVSVATASMLKTFPNLRQLGAGTLTPEQMGHLESRAARIVALAAVRSDGAVGAVTGSAESRKGENLGWAITVLRKMSVARPTDASTQADLGEALAKTPATQKEALTILAKLATDDVIGSPHAYAALARLHRTAGDAAKSAEAVKRCEGMTTTPAICQPGPAVKGAEPPKAKDDAARSRA